MKDDTPQNFVLQLGALISLYLSISFLLLLIFSLINLVIPDSTELYYSFDSNATSVRVGIAMLLVFFPTYLVLTRKVNKIRRQQSDNTYLSLTKWLIYLSLLLAALTLLIDLVVLIIAFMEGEVTQRFLFKALAVFIVIGAGFYYYLLDAKGYWLKHERNSIMFGLGASIVVIAAVGYGLTHIEAPAEVREAKIDDRQIQDLQSIQWQIEDFYYQNERIPEALTELENIPTNPAEREQYTYAVTETGFELCATFTTSNLNEYASGERAYPMEKGVLIPNAWNWEHDIGRHCFERTVNTD